MAVPESSSKPTEETQHNEYDLQNSKNKEKVVTAGKVLNECNIELENKILKGEITNIHDLCVESDKLIESKLSVYYKKGGMSKGVAFPTCINRNKTVANYSPASKEESQNIEPGDTLIVEMGGHFDNFGVFLGNMFTVPHPDKPETQDMMTPMHEKPSLAMHFLKELILHGLVPGNNTERMIKEANILAESLGCSIVQNVNCELLAHTLSEKEHKRFALNPSQDIRKDSISVNFEAEELYLIDVIVAKDTFDVDGHKKIVKSVKNVEQETTLYQIPDYFMSAKVNEANKIYSKISKKFGNNIFTTRGLLSDSREVFGFNNLRQQLEEYPVTVCSNGEIAYRIKFTALVKKNRGHVIAGKPLQLKKLIESTDYKRPSSVMEYMGINHTKL